MKNGKFSALAITVIMVLAGSTAGTLWGQSMKAVGASVELPKENEMATLTGLGYYYPLKVEFTGITWDVKETKGDKMKIHWTLAGTSGRARPQRTRFKMDLLDADGESVKTVIKMFIFKPSTDGQEFEFDLKIKQSEWEATDQLRFQVSFLIGA